MAYKIKKSKEFLRNVLNIISYIEKEWGITSAVKFQTILDSKIDKLSIRPYSGMMTTKIRAFENYLLPNIIRYIIASIKMRLIS